jgi:hypothetical protein
MPPDSSPKGREEGWVAWAWGELGQAGPWVGAALHRMSSAAGRHLRAVWKRQGWVVAAWWKEGGWGGETVENMVVGEVCVCAFAGGQTTPAVLCAPHGSPSIAVGAIPLPACLATTALLGRFGRLVVVEDDAAWDGSRRLRLGQLTRDFVEELCGLTIRPQSPINLSADIRVESSDAALALALRDPAEDAAGCEEGGGSRTVDVGGGLSGGFHEEQTVLVRVRLHHTHGRLSRQRSRHRAHDFGRH